MARTLPRSYRAAATLLFGLVVGCQTLSPALVPCPISSVEQANKIQSMIPIGMTREAAVEKLKQSGVSKVIIERPHKKCRITVHTARPGMVIGKKGADIETLRKEIAKLAKSVHDVNTADVAKAKTKARA